MKLKAADHTVVMNRMAGNGNANPQPPAEETPKESTFTDKAMIGLRYGGAGTAGALGGMGLGGVAGKLLTNATGFQAFQDYGAIVGVVAGGAAAIGGQTDNETLKKSMYAQALATTGMTAGLYLGDLAGNFLTNAGAAGHFAANGTLIGASALGLIGAAMPFDEYEGFGEKLHDFKSVVKGGTIGYYLGGGAQALTANLAPALSPAMQFAPALYGVTGALVGAANSIDTHPGYDENDELKEKNGYQKFGEFADTAASFGVGSSIGFTAGSAAGVGINILTKSMPGLAQHYAYSAPILGAATGGMIAAANQTDNDAWSKAAAITGSSGIGMALGDLAGYGLTNLTGMPIYSTLGSAMGAATGGSMAAFLTDMDRESTLGKVGHYAAPLAAGATVGSAAGALVGALLSHFLENGVYQVVGSGLGTAAGTLTGLAIALKRAQDAGNEG